MARSARRARHSLTQPDEPSTDDGTPDARHVDLRLQTRLASERLQGRLLSIYYDAQTYEQEQGVSILYLAMGFLKWYESPSSDKARYAPLLSDPGGSRTPDGRQPVPPEVSRRRHHHEPLAPGEAEGRVRHRPPRSPRDGRAVARGVLRRRRRRHRRPASLGGLEGRHGRLVLLVREVSDVPRPRPGDLAGALAAGKQPDPVEPPG